MQTLARHNFIEIHKLLHKVHEIQGNAKIQFYIFDIIMTFVKKFRRIVSLHRELEFSKIIKLKLFPNNFDAICTFVAFQQLIL